MWQTVVRTSDVTDEREIHYKFVVSTFLRNFLPYDLFDTMMFNNDIHIERIICINKEFLVILLGYVCHTWCLEHFVSVASDVHNSPQYKFAIWPLNIVIIVKLARMEDRAVKYMYVAIFIHE